jgi:uncharacterized protein (DUF58 family)
LLFSDQVEHFVPPKKGRGHVNRILRDLYFQKPLHSTTKIAPAIQYIQGVLKKKAIVFVFSDFNDEGFAESLRMIAKKHDVIAVVVDDKAERTLPRMGLVDLRDAETGEVYTVDTSSKSFREAFEVEVKRRIESRESELRKAGVDRIDVSTNSDFVAPLASYFRRRGSGGRK